MIRAKRHLEIKQKYDLIKKIEFKVEKYGKRYQRPKNKKGSKEEAPTTKTKVTIIMSDEKEREFVEVVKVKWEKITTISIQKKRNGHLKELSQDL